MENVEFFYSTFSNKQKNQIKSIEKIKAGRKEQRGKSKEERAGGAIAQGSKLKAQGVGSRDRGKGQGVEAGKPEVRCRISEVRRQHCRRVPEHPV
jgi:hypothetical protein